VRQLLFGPGDPDRVIFVVNVRYGAGGGSFWQDITLPKLTARPPSAKCPLLRLQAGFVRQEMREPEPVEQALTQLRPKKRKQVQSA